MSIKSEWQRVTSAPIPKTLWSSALVQHMILLAIPGHTDATRGYYHRVLNEFFIDGTPTAQHPTHWMPLPKLPPMEDLITVKIKGKKLTIDRRAAVDDLKRFNGVPPHDGFNPCCGDNIFEQSLVEKYGMPVPALARAVEFDKIIKEWHAIRADYIKT